MTIIGWSEELQQIYVSRPGSNGPSVYLSGEGDIVFHSPKGTTSVHIRAVEKEQK